MEIDGMPSFPRRYQYQFVMVMAVGNYGKAVQIFMQAGYPQVFAFEQFLDRQMVPLFRASAFHGAASFPCKRL
jgi:hypothetical protein